MMKRDDELICRFEKIPTEIFEDAYQASVRIAKKIADSIIEKQKEGRAIVLGLATGSTPVGIYAELVRLHKIEGLSFKNVITFNLDEYYPMDPKALQSYVRFMHEYLFDHIDIDPKNINIPDGTIKENAVYEYCKNYETKIESCGGIDIQLLGIGRTGHIGFNEPGSPINSMTRRITLDHLTITDAASDFYGEQYVPKTAITMGVGSIMKAKKIILLAWGEAKSYIIQKAVEGEITKLIPATFLQEHSNAEIVLDKAAAAELTRIKTPWLVEDCDWDNKLIRKAVVWLCQILEKPILKLTDRDYNDNGMGALVTKLGPAYNINIKVFNDLQHTITGWPGGKPNADDSNRPERAKPFPKKVLVFSPHPDDDVISMGGTLSRLVEQGNEVHVVYQTSGSIAVFDDDAIRYLDFVRDYDKIFEVGCSKSDDIYNKTLDFILNKAPGQVDSKEIQDVKASIRRGEARSACRFTKIADHNIHFLDMPFYETGKVKKKPLGEEDVRLTMDIIRKIRPDQIYAAGDLSDPHGTHRVCMNAIMEAINRLKNEKWMKACYVWLYRGAWQEWDIDQVDMAVPLSPDEVVIKRRAIFKHQSQKDRPLYPGHDAREFWKRAEDRNHGTAEMYDKLGMAEYQAIEVFARYKIK
ncbi:MAG: glucosamine-6-phosphate deaminase [Bacteroidetes bacterium HGW-Bacteroidetes-17]|jgi:glucosamine-6-phosphate deaminase|nr:MAG: glucosamine-6-phosphate deaminase [Bacteroidetes bacterium HGW-Bacteroidetes-17]